MNILGLTKTTLLDYPSRVAATVFIGGCNFRCPFCHNGGIVFQNGELDRIEIEDIMKFLYKRRNVLTGVCVTGGEPTLNKELPSFLMRIKEMGYMVKLDTNGSNPDMVWKLIEDGLVDYCAMDVKNCARKYAQTCGCDLDGRFDIGKINDCISLILGQDKIDYEFRTTVVRELHDENDMREIAMWINGAKHYYIQSYTDSPEVIEKRFSAYDAKMLEHFADVCREFVPNVCLRGVSKLS